MPQNDNFGFNVEVGDEALFEHTGPDGNIYIESSIKTAQSYTHKTDCDSEVFVTPYVVKISTKRQNPLRFYKLHIDGKFICRAFVHGNKERIITGVVEQGVMHDFVFTFPREAQQKSTIAEDALKAIGEITVDEYEAINTGRVETYSRTTFVPIDSQKTNMRAPGHDTKLGSICKKDLTKLTSGQYPMLHTGTGKASSYRQQLGARKQRTVYLEGSLVSSITLYYRPRLALEVMGVLTKKVQEEVTDKAESTEPECIVIDSTLEGSLLETSEDDISVSECIMPSPAKSKKKPLKCLTPPNNNILKMQAVCSPVTARNVKREPSTAEDSEDICLWTDEPSICCEGDEDCLITRIRKPWDITVLDLSDFEDDDSDQKRRKSMAIYLS